MITIILCLFVGMLAYVSAKNGETGSVVIAILIIAAILILRSGMRNDALARIHWTDYWAKGGPEAQRGNVRYIREAEKGTTPAVTVSIRNNVCNDCCSVRRVETIYRAETERHRCPICGKETYVKRG